MSGRIVAQCPYCEAPKPGLTAFFVLPVKPAARQVAVRVVDVFGFEPEMVETMR